MDVVYIVTGASRGLGWNLLQKITEYLDASALAISRSGLEAPMPRVQDLRCDLATREGQREAAAALKASVGSQTWRKAVLINNAGIVEPVAPVERCDPEALARNILVNLTAPLVLMQAFIEASHAVSRRCIINISSGAGRKPAPNLTGYCTGKAGLDMASLVANLEAESGSPPLTVTSIAPGMVDTAMQATMRSLNKADFPAVTHFRKVWAQGGLSNASEIAGRILELERAGKLPTGVADISEL
jgi:benzil reductase ((S)-benzoin forming)